MTEIDDALTHTGAVTGFSLLIEPHNGKNGATTFESTPPCVMSQTDFIDVPPGATNLTILVTNLTTPGPQPISLYVKYGAWPTTNNFDEVTNLVPPVTNGVISIGPPLTPGRYFYGVYAPCSDTASQSNSVTATYYMGAVPAQVVFGSSGPAPILDDAVVTNTIYVTAAQTISSVDVSLRVDHPRVSDLVFHLTSPAGSRVLLVENRGGTTTNGMGQTLAITNVVPVSSSGSSSPTTNVVNTVTSSGALEINYNFYTLPDEMVIYDQSGSGVPIFDSGLISGSGIFNIAYTNSNFLTIEMNPFGNNEGTGDLWDYAVVAAQVKYTYLTLTENTNLTTTPIKFAPPPFVGVLTNVFGKAVVTNITTSLTNTVVVTNTLIITNTVITTNLIANEWHNSFEGYSYSVFSAPSHFAGGWSVDSGSVDVYVNGGPPPSGSTADEGTNYIDLDGSTPGTISTNLATVPGQSYTLTFTYAQNADGKSFDHPTASMQVLQNSNPLLSLTVNQTNGWSNLGWTTTSAVFTATANPTKISFQSLDPAGDAYGVLLDCVNLASPMNDGFENTAIGNYAAGVNPGFAGWAVTTNQVTVISNTTLAYGGSTNLLALANGTISRILPTVPGQTYVLTYAYRGPGAISLWRGEGNAIDPISANNGTAENDLGYAAGEVNSAFNMATAGYVFIPASPSLDIGPGPGFTLDAWIAPTAISAANPYPIIEWSQAGGVYSGLSFFVSSFFFNSSGCLCAGFVASNNVAVGNSIFSAPNIVTANVFQHVALTYNHTTGAAAMYLNGVRVASTNNVGNFVTWTTGNVLIGRRININTPSQNFHFPGSEDEISIYGRDLSASEILAIYQKGSLGKYDLAAPTFAQGLAEAQLTLGGTPFPVFYGNNTNWQTTNITFVAAQSNLVLQVAGLEPGMLLDSFALTNVVYVTNITYTNIITVCTNTATNGFEGAVAGDYTQGWMFDGWVVTNQQVTVISNTVLANEGTNLLALANGTITRVLPTVAGHAYNLTYAYRGPSAIALWRGETNNAQDEATGTHNGIITTAFLGYVTNSPGEVRNAFDFHGSNFVEIQPIALTNCTFDFWCYQRTRTLKTNDTEWGTVLLSDEVCNIVDDWHIGILSNGHLVFFMGNGVGGYDSAFQSASVIPLNTFTHVAVTRSVITGKIQIYINGLLDTTTNSPHNRVMGIAESTCGVPNTIGIGFLLRMAELGNPFPYVDVLDGKMDETTIYDRTLSASEILAIYQNGSSGKYDTTAPTIAQGLAEAQMVVDGFAFPPFYGSNTNWQTNTISFNAAQSNSVLQITGLEPGMLLDNFVLTQPVIATNYLLTTNLDGSDIYYQPEQSLDTYKENGESAYGQWQLEIWDNRAGAGLTNTLVNWQLRFNFATPYSPFGTLTNGVPLTNPIVAGSIQYYKIIVPTNADIATNFLLYATNSLGTDLPLNVWFNQTNLPSGTNSPGDYLLIHGTNGTYILYTNGVPPLIPGSTYFIGIQNTNAVTVIPNFYVDFHLVVPPVPIVLIDHQPQTNTITTNEIVYYLVNVPTNADWATNLLLFASGPLNVWYNSTNLPVPANPPDTLLFSAATTGKAIFGTNLITSPTNIVPGGSYYLAVQNPGVISVTYGIEVDFHLILPPVLPVIPHQYIVPGQTMTVTNTATGQPTLVYTMTSTVTNLPAPAIDINGIITWTPTNYQAPNTYTITTVVTDGNTPPLSATNSFLVTVIVPAFPGAEGAGAGALGGRGGDVYHVRNLNDGGPGSLRYGITNVPGNRTIVFDLSGNINLLSALSITNTDFTIAGQTAPGDGVTLGNWLTSVANTHDVVLRFMRFRPGDLNCPLNQEDSFNFDTVTNSIVDHVSASWSINATLSALRSSEVTVQWSMMAEALNNSCHTNASGPGTQLNGYGSLLRYGSGMVSFHHNLYADNYSSNPRLGDSLQLDFINNVVFNWGIEAGFNLDDTAGNPGGYTNALNYIGNYFIVGTNTTANQTTAFASGVPNISYTWIYQLGNFIDSQTNTVLNGANTQTGMFSGNYTSLAGPLDQLPGWPGIPVTTNSAPNAYEQVLDFAGASLLARDSVDAGIVAGVRYKNGFIIDSQAQVGGWPLLDSAPLPLDTDGDGMPDYWEITLFQTGQTNMNPNVANNDHFNPDGYTDLEHYINWLAVPHALTVTNTPVAVDLFALAGRTGNLNFGVTNGTNGAVTLGTDGHTATFMPATNYFGFASFGFSVTNLATANQFDVTVSVMVSATNIVMMDPPLTNGVPQTNSVPANGFAYYLVNVPTNAQLATNILLFAGAPVNVWFSQAGFPTGTNTGNYILLANSTGGKSLLSTISVPTNIVPGGTYYLGIQNPNSGPVNFAIEVDFYPPPPVPITPQVITIDSITYTNFGGTNGYLLKWQGPTNFQYEIQWTTNIGPLVAWSTVLNPVINTILTTTNGHFSWFDDGTLSGGFRVREILPDRGRPEPGNGHRFSSGHQHGPGRGHVAGGGARAGQRLLSEQLPDFRHRPVERVVQPDQSARRQPRRGRPPDIVRRHRRHFRAHEQFRAAARAGRELLPRLPKPGHQQRHVRFRGGVWPPLHQCAVRRGVPFQHHRDQRRHLAQVERPDELSVPGAVDHQHRATRGVEYGLEHPAVLHQRSFHLLRQRLVDGPGSAPGNFTGSSPGRCRRHPRPCPFPASPPPTLAGPMT